MGQGREVAAKAPGLAPTPTRKQGLRSKRAYFFFDASVMAWRTWPLDCLRACIALGRFTFAPSITTATGVRLPLSFRARPADSWSAPVASATMRIARWINFSFLVQTFTMRLPYTYPRRVMAPVEIMLRTILSAEPAFRREDPARTSGPTSVTTAKSAARSRGELRLQVRAMVWAPRRRAYSTAAMVKGVRPLVAMPRTISCLPGLRFLISLMARRVSSSLASVEEPSALGPPAMMNWTVRGWVLNVGGISEASRAPRRPLVPAPT